LFDQPLQADVTADLKSKLLALQEKQQPGDTAVAVTKRMDTEKVEVKGNFEESEQESFARFQGKPAFLALKAGEILLEH